MRMRFRWSVLVSALVACIAMGVIFAGIEEFYYATIVLTPLIMLLLAFIDVHFSRRQEKARAR